MSVLLDEETVVLEALDFEVPCRKVGDHAAELAFTCRSCGFVDFSCRPHFEELRRIVDAWAERGVRAVHVRCGFRATSLDELVRVVTL